MGTDDLLDSPEISPKPTAQQIAREQPVGFLMFIQRLADWAGDNGWTAKFKQAKGDTLKLEYTFSPDLLFPTKVRGCREYGALSITKLNERLRGVREESGWTYELVSMQNGKLQCTFSQGGGRIEPPVISKPKPRAPLPGGRGGEGKITMDGFFKALAKDSPTNVSKERINELAAFVKERLPKNEQNKTLKSFYDAVFGLWKKENREWDFNRESRGETGPPLSPDFASKVLRRVWEVYGEGAVKIPEHRLTQEEIIRLRDVKKDITAFLKNNRQSADRGRRLFAKLERVLQVKQVADTRALEWLLTECEKFLESGTKTPPSGSGSGGSGRGGGDNRNNPSVIAASKASLSYSTLPPPKFSSESCDGVVKKLQRILGILRTKPEISDTIWIKRRGEKQSVTAQEILTKLLEIPHGKNARIAVNKEELTKWNNRLKIGERAVEVIGGRLDRANKK